MFGIALVVAGIFFAFLFVFAVAAFIALVFSVLSLAAWDEPLNLFGETLHPREARAFVYRGFAGAVLLPAFAVFVSALFRLQIQPDYWIYIFIGGYTAGSVGVEYLAAQAQAKAAPTPQTFVSPAAAPEPPPQALPRPPFEFASWNDEERQP